MLIIFIWWRSISEIFYPDIIVRIRLMFSSVVRAIVIGKKHVRSKYLWIGNQISAPICPKLYFRTRLHNFHYYLFLPDRSYLETDCCQEGIVQPYCNIAVTNNSYFILGLFLLELLMWYSNLCCDLLLHFPWVTGFYDIFRIQGKCDSWMVGSLPIVHTLGGNFRCLYSFYCHIFL